MNADRLNEIRDLLNDPVDYAGQASGLLKVAALDLLAALDVAEQQAVLLIEEGDVFLRNVRALEKRAVQAEQERDEAVRERDNLKRWQRAYSKGRAGMVAQADQDFDRAEAAEARAIQLETALSEARTFALVIATRDVDRHITHRRNGVELTAGCLMCFDDRIAAVLADLAAEEEKA